MCMDCVARDIRKFLPKKLTMGFQRFHENFYHHFDSPQLVLNGAVYCMNCRSTKESPICPNCYIKEAYQWLEEKDKRLAKRFLKLFSFGGPIDFRSDSEAPVEEEFGVCDECGEYTEELVMVNGEWVCKECAGYRE